MFNTLPCHVGDMEQAVDAIEIKEYAEVGDIFNDSFTDDRQLEYFQGDLLSWKFVLLQASSRRDTTTFLRSILILRILNS